MMGKKTTVLTVCFFLTVCAGFSFAAEELYVVDLREAPGKILEVRTVTWSRHPVLRPVFTRPAEYIHTLAFHKYGRAYFVDISHQNIFATDGLKEEKIFSFATPIQDMDFDSRGRMYFSAVGGEEGVVYFLNPYKGETSRVVGFSFRALADETRGFWNGYFAFDPADKLFLSIDGPSGSGSSLYEYSGGRLRKRFTHDERITGFTFVNNQTVYFTTASNRVYELKNFSEVSVKHQEREGRMLNDVEVVEVPEGGDCTISGQLKGGRELWGTTSVQALGPNVVWRTQPGASSARVSGDGRYVLRNLPRGRYRVHTDIRGDTPVGFAPDSRTTNCGGVVTNIDFTYSR